ncbi:MAG: thiolase family protein [Bacteroidetes bacterium]|nr:thiolase family protein [Bacteroidota bacterium]
MEALIYGAKRTPTGSFGGSLSSFSATELGSKAIEGLFLENSPLKEEIQEVFMGNVVSANLGQAPARQAALGAGLSENVICTTINKVCASGMKSAQLAAMSIQAGINEWVIAGGMESMSQVPHYIPSLRWGNKYGNAEILDGLSKDGLSDAYNGEAMGTCGDATAKKYHFTREEQDNYAIESYKRTAFAAEKGLFNAEIVPITIPQRKGVDIVFKEDEEFRKVDFSKIPLLKPAFSPDGTVTAANASTLNDGASALLLGSKNAGEKSGIKPMGRIVSFADAEVAPEFFTIAPVKAAPLALNKAGLTWEDISFIEVNEAFAIVPLVFAKTFSIPSEKLNVRGGGVSMGHPLGSSGSRILVTLIHTLQQNGGGYGLAAICNGGGGASAMVIEVFPIE